jgi:hypothetical protein
MERIAEIMQKFPACCRKDTFGALFTGKSGARLRVFLCFMVVTAWGLAQNQTVWSIIVMNFVGSTCLQLGYLAGTAPSFLMIAARQSRGEHPQPARPLLHRRSC